MKLFPVTRQGLLPWTYSVLLHSGFLLLLVLSVHWTNSTLPSLGGTNPNAEPVQATVVDQSLIDQQMAMLKAQEQKKQQEQQALEQNISSLRQQQQTAQQQLTQQMADLQKQAQAEQDKLAKLKAEDADLDKKRKSAETAQRRQQLQQEIASEEKARDARMASLYQQYIGLIKQKVNNSWIKPATAAADLKCTVLVSQVPGGEVTNVQLQDCNGDDAVKQSIMTAVYKASPLPPPPDPSLFDRSIKFVFDNKH